MEKAEKEVNNVYISNRQLISSLMALICTLCGLLGGIGYYFASDLIDTSKTMGKIARTNEHTIERILRQSKETSAALKHHASISETVHVECQKRITKIEKEAAITEYKINNYLR